MEVLSRGTITAEREERRRSMQLPATRQAGCLCFFLLLLLVLLSSRVAAVVAASEDGGGASSKEWCLEAGFNPETLKCSTCDKLHLALAAGTAEATGAGLVGECKQCCSDEGEGTAQQQLYVLAKLEFDRMLLQFLPQLKAFMDGPGKALQEEGLLKVEYKPGSRPALQLFAEGQKTPGEVVSVGQWQPDTIAEFVRENLTPPTTPQVATAQQ